MLLQGWSTDTVGKFDSPDGNIGWYKRRNLFLESATTTEEVFSNTPIPLIGRLVTDFQSLDKEGKSFLTPLLLTLSHGLFPFAALVPGKAVRVTVNWNEPHFYLWQAADNTNDYCIRVIDASLYVDVYGISCGTLDLWHPRFYVKNEPVIYTFNGKLFNFRTPQPIIRNYVNDLFSSRDSHRDAVNR
jgi:hypothetical protein